ncbi:SpoIIE family protein phosphatase [Streptomyces sp. NPDC051567]|uniref:SpoIIE family protein phosphatase n=1 Tax=Streptomyces sp. NPDC051567 TaxID=3365660 RepID=UPI0037958A28
MMRAQTLQVRRVCVLGWAGAAVSWELSSPGRMAASLATCVAFLLLATVCALHIRRGLLAQLRRSQEIAGAAQRAVLRPLPGRIAGLTPAAAQLSASRGAAVGGDLYEAVPTAYGVRVVIGDVRGHGLPALGAAAAVLGAFREAAYDEVSLGGVLLRMERALGRHVRDRAHTEHPPSGPAGQHAPAAEEFVTVLLLQIGRDGSLRALNCGHPWPYLIRPAPGVRAERERHGARVRAGARGLAPRSPAEPRGPARRPGAGRRYRVRRPARPRRDGPPVPVARVRPPAGTREGTGRADGPGSGGRAEVRALAGGETLPPLGVVPLPPGVRPRFCGRLRPGETLFLHTDGAEDARDRSGRFFPLRGALARAAALAPARLVADVHAALLRHTGGRLTDDVALLVLRNDRA